MDRFNIQIIHIEHNIEEHSEKVARQYFEKLGFEVLLSSEYRDEFYLGAEMEFILNMKKGLPDLAIYNNVEHPIFVEVKTPNTGLSKHQLDVMKVINKLGFQTWVAYVKKSGHLKGGQIKFRNTSVGKYLNRWQRNKRIKDYSEYIKHVKRHPRLDVKATWLCGNCQNKFKVRTPLTNDCVFKFPIMSCKCGNRGGRFEMLECHSVSRREK